MRIPKSIRWFVIGALARQAARLAASRSVDRATEDLQQVLPPSASKVVAALPDSVLRAGGAAVATGKATRRAANTTMTAKQLASGQTKKFRSAIDRSKALVNAGRGAIAAESAEQRRTLRSELALQLRGQKAADDSLLDIRPIDRGNEFNSSEFGSETSVTAKSYNNVDPNLPTAADAIPPGRPKRLPNVPKTVARVQRLYRAPVKPWDRPSR